MGDERDQDFMLERRRSRGLPPLAAKRDPETSKRAAASVVEVPRKLAEAELAIALELVNWPDGLTACELATKLNGRRCRGALRDYGWWRLECSRRLGRMADRVRLAEHPTWTGWTLLRGKARVCRIAGTYQTVWIPCRS